MFSAVSHFRNVRPWLTYIQSVERFLQLILLLVLLVKLGDELFAFRLGIFKTLEHLHHPLLLLKVRLGIRGDLIKHSALIERLGALYMTLVISAYPLL